MTPSQMWIEDYSLTNKKGLYFLDENGKKRIILVYDGDWSGEEFIPFEITYVKKD